MLCTRSTASGVSYNSIRRSCAFAMELTTLLVVVLGVFVAILAPIIIIIRRRLQPLKLWEVQVGLTVNHTPEWFSSESQSEVSHHVSHPSLHRMRRNAIQPFMDKMGQVVLGGSDFVAAYGWLHTPKHPLRTTEERCGRWEQFEGMACILNDVFDDAATVKRRIVHKEDLIGLVKSGKHIFSEK
ncbi:uncharacterized protein EV422DRAFT_614732, partial [Fimicolochytrium jonesii]|uniref:uncharacterized protein n=1 Tax=Fimicolochytrium jonesii TaxID=1396493 RepID=UPI0022FECA1C